MLEQFVQMTQRIIREDGFDNYLPTLLLPATRQVRVLDQPEDDQGRPVALSDWIAGQVAPDEDFLIAFRMDDAHFMVLGRLAGQQCQRVCAVEPGA